MATKKGRASDHADLTKEEMIELLDRTVEFSNFQEKLIQMYELNFDFSQVELAYVKSVIDANEKLETLRYQEFTAKKQELDEKVGIIKARSKFFSDVSHEFRNLLTLSLTPLEALLIGETGPINEDQRKIVSLVYDSCKKAVNFVNDLLELSRLDAHRVKLLVQKVDFSRICRELVNLFLPTASHKQMHFVLEIDEKIDKAWFDVNKIESVIINFISNAIKYGKSKSAILVELKDKGNSIEFAVTSEAAQSLTLDMKKLFERYETQDENTDQNTLGFGIGLALCKQLIEVHRGKIGLEAKGDQKNRFYFILKKGLDHYPKEKLKVGWGDLERRSPERVQEQIERQVGAGVTSLYREIGNFYELSNTDIHTLRERLAKDGLGEATLLIVENNIELLRFLEYIFGVRYKVIIKTGVDEALKAIESDLPDLVICDVNLKGVNGLEFCERMKSNPRTTKIPFVLISAQTSSFILGLEMGADDFLVKPFNLNELMVRVHNLIKRKHLDDIIADQYEQVQKDLELARKIQEGLLPHTLPEPREYTFETLCKPVEMVAGDFYDIVDFQGEIGILIIDVSGHGVAAAFIASMVKMIFSTAAFDFRSPLKLMRYMNQHLHGKLSDEFVAAFYGILNLRTHVFRYCNAGQNLPFVFREKTNKITNLEGKGILLGLKGRIRLYEETVELNPGDKIILYTDGITEAIDDKEKMYGENRLKKLLTDLISKNEKKIAEKVLNDVTKFAGKQTPHDDMTMVLIKRNLKTRES